MNQTKPYTVHEQHAAEPHRRLLGPPLSHHENYTDAVEEAKSRAVAQQGMQFAVRINDDLIVWPL